RLEATTFGADEVAASAEDEVGVELVLCRDGCPVLADGFCQGDTTTAARRARPLRELLVLDMHASRACPDIGLHGGVDVESAAKAGVRVRENAHVRDFCHTPDRFDELLAPDDPDVRHAVDVGGELRPG